MVDGPSADMEEVGAEGLTKKKPCRYTLKSMLHMHTERFIFCDKPPSRPPRRRRRGVVRKSALFVTKRHESSHYVN